MPASRARIAAALLLAGVAVPVAHAGITVNITGVEGEMQRNVQTFLSVERYRERNDIDQDTMDRLYKRVDDEARGALRPFGYYEPKIDSGYRASGRDWIVDVRIEPGEPVRIRELAIRIEGPGADDPAFDGIRTQNLLRIGARLNHGSYEQVKGEMTRVAAAEGYLAARLEQSKMLVDVESHSAAVGLVLQTGPQYHFGDISIEQTVIRPELMRRFLRFSEGDPYSSTELLRTQFALDDSLYFSTIDVEPGEPDPETLTVPVRITAAKSRPILTMGAGYGTDTSVRGTLGWTDSRVNDRGHRLRFEIKASTIRRSIESRYDIPIGDPALERFSVEGLNIYQDKGDLDTNETTLRPSITRMLGRWQTVSSLSLTRTSTRSANDRFSSNLLVPGVVLASVPEGFLGEALFTRAFYAELIGSHSALGSDADFLRLLLQMERNFDLTSQWHLLLRGEFGTSLVSNFSELPGIYRFFAGGDRSVRGFAVDSLSPRELVTDADGNTSLDNVGGRHLLVGSVELVRDLPYNLAAATFFDIGNAFDDFGDELEYSVGVGVRYRLPVVSIGLDVAKPVSTGGGLRLHLNITPKL